MKIIKGTKYVIFLFSLVFPAIKLAKFMIIKNIFGYFLLHLRIIFELYYLI